MKIDLRQTLVAFAASVFVFLAGAIFSQPLGNLISSAVVTAQEAKTEEAEWGSFSTYYQGETYGTKDVLTGVAVLKPGQEIHPPHQHAEEEYLMILEGEGTWHLNGKTFAAQAGDILYATPWDMHGIKNTGQAALKFVVWKWHNKGVTSPTQPSTSNK
ncbi:cupin domain-containing protein [candidate division KSB1 bacterium]|nr:cupin domain-containing protein [candidate division KSB1 bacterium]